MEYWAVGSSHNKIDITEDFLKNSRWYDGYANDGDDRDRDFLSKVQIGDIILMKSSSTKGKGHKT